MSAQALPSRLGWLLACLGTQKHKIITLLGRAADIGKSHAMKPALFQKFMHLMEQVAVAKDEEMHILSEINAIEQKHRFCRKTGKLKHPKPPLTDETLALKNERADCEEYDGYDDEYYTLEDGSLISVKSSNGIWGSSGVAPPQRPSYGWLWLIAFWYLLTNSGVNNKKQRLTAD